MIHKVEFGDLFLRYPKIRKTCGVRKNNQKFQWPPTKSLKERSVYAPQTDPQTLLSQDEIEIYQGQTPDGPQSAVGWEEKIYPKIGPALDRKKSSSQEIDDVSLKNGNPMKMRKGRQR